jgi:uncharacterized protein (TIGR02646 family)
MITLLKLPIPKVLKEKGADWTKELMDAKARGEDLSTARRNRYNNSEIKKTLLRETHDKCAYCEAKLTHVTYGDVEHVVPKSAQPELTYEWGNLTVACDICNTKKGNIGGLVDPYSEDPEAVHFRFMGPMLTLRADSEVGKLTLMVLELNRASLIERRKDRVDNLGRRLGEVLKTKDPQLKQVLLDALVRDETGAEKEFAATARAYVSDKQADGEIPA